MKPAWRRALSVVLVGAALVSGACSQRAKVGAGEVLVQRSVEFHDPNGHWPTRMIELMWSSQRPDGSESMRLEIAMASATGFFELSGTRAGRHLEYFVASHEDGDEIEVRVDGELDLDEETLELMAMTREGGLFWRNYFGFLAGLPMNILDGHAQIGAKPERSELAGKPVDAVTVTYPEADSDLWTLYFDPETAQLVGCRFDRADPERIGETIEFEGLVEAEGLRLPKHRRWTMNDDGRFIGSDTILRLALGE